MCAEIESILRNKMKDLKRREKRISEKLKEYENEDKLSKHGMWSKGYWIGKGTEVEENIFFIEGLLENVDRINSNKLFDEITASKNQGKPITFEIK